MGDSINKLSHNKLLLRDAKILLRDFIYKLYINKVYLFLREGKLFLKNSIFSLYINKVNLLLRDAKLLMRDSTYKLYIKSVPLSEGCQTLFEGFY